MDSTDPELLKAARDGDGDALQHLLSREQERIYRFGMKMCRHPEDAEDVLQDTLLAAAQSINDFRGASSLATWLYTIARSFCIKKRRKSKFAPDHVASLESDAASEARELAADERSPDEVAHDREVNSILAHAIAQLEPEQREVLVLRDVEGLKATEVAEVVGISIPAVKSRLHRARARVRELAAPKLGETLEERPATCPDVMTLYSRHLEGEISAELCTEMERHLETCPLCRETCNSLKRTLSLCSTLPVTRVPTAVQESVREALREFLSQA